MKYCETDSQGSFTARGTGFTYRYISKDSSLDVASAHDGSEYLRLKFDRRLRKNPLLFVEHFDKTNKINALAYSKNRTVNLADTLSPNHISAILKSTARTSLYAHKLSHNNFKEFSHLFSSDTRLRKLRIRQILAPRDERHFYSARLQTINNRGLRVNSCNLPQLMKFLSEKTLHDLVVQETGNESAAHNLLKVSMKLSILSHILDPRFVPEQCLLNASNRMAEPHK